MWRGGAKANRFDKGKIKGAKQKSTRFFEARAIPTIFVRGACFHPINSLD